MWPDLSGAQPVHMALGSLECLERMLECDRTDINARDFNGATCLMYAAYAQNEGAIKARLCNAVHSHLSLLSLLALLLLYVIIIIIMIVADLV